MIHHNIRKMIQIGDDLLNYIFKDNLLHIYPAPA